MEPNNEFTLYECVFVCVCVHTPCERPVWSKIHTLSELRIKEQFSDTFSLDSTKKQQTSIQIFSLTQLYISNG
jgi:hypothetical protein